MHRIVPTDSSRQDNNEGHRP